MDACFFKVGPVHRILMISQCAKFYKLRYCFRLLYVVCSCWFMNIYISMVYTFWFSLVAHRILNLV